MRALPFSLAVNLFLLACSPAPQPTTAHKKPVAGKDAGSGIPSDPRWLAGHLLAEVPEGTFGPYVAYGTASALALYAPANAKGRRWFAQRLSPAGAPLGKVVDVGAAPEEAPAVAVRALGEQEGFAALWSHKSASGTAVNAVWIDSSGQARSEAAVLTQTTGQIVWVEAIASNAGPVLLWAEQQKDRAAIFTSYLDSKGKAAGPASQVIPAARAWQVAQTPRGAALAIVRPGDNPEAGATVVLQMLDNKGRASGPTTVVSDSPTAGLDVDVARVGTGLVLGWTDRRDLDHHVYVSATDLNGKVVVAPRPLNPAVGEQSLLGLVASREGDTALVAYEDLSQRAPDQRALRLTTIDSQGKAGGRIVALEYPTTERDLPEFASSSEGFVALTKGRPCAAGGSCDKREAESSYVRFDSSLAILGGAPLWVDRLSGSTPANSWGLGCTRDSCQVLVAGSTTPAPVVAVPIPKSKSTFVPAATMLAAPVPPYLGSNQVFRTLEQNVSEVSATQVGERFLVAWITYFVEPPPGSPPPAPNASVLPKGVPASAIPGDPSKPTAANLSVVSLEASGNGPVVPTIISVRALSAGGVTIAAGAPNNKDACLAWVARDGGDPQVFVTRVSAEGKREGQQMLTRVKGDAYDAAAVWAGDGWVIAWVDQRDGNGEVYAAKVDRALRKTVQDTRLTNAPGDASDVGLFAQGNEVYISWSDPRDHSNDGHGDPYVRKVNAATLAPLGAETRLELSVHHARSVHVAFSGQDLVAGWLAQPLGEVALGGPDQPGPRMVRLDPKTAAPQGDIARLRWEAGRIPTSFGFHCTEEACQGVLAASLGDTLRADALLWFPTSPVFQTRPLTTLKGPSSEDIYPTVLGENLFYADEASAGDVRLRRARVRWRSKE